MFKLFNLVKNCLVGILLFSGLNANSQDSLDMNKIENRIDKYLTYFSGESPGAVISVLKKGDVLFTKAYGLNNIDKKENINEDDLFNLGELSKSFTALAVLKLIEKNKLSFDNTLKDIFPEFPDYGKYIKVKDILDHKSGLANYDTGKVFTNKDVYDYLAEQKEPIFEPGSEFVYSNSDYPLLVNIIEKTAKMSYQDFLKKYFFKKLDMDNTYFIEDIKGKTAASSHFKENSEYVVKNEIKYIYGDRGIYTNVLDYTKYDKALYTDKLLKCETLKSIFRVAKLTNNENISDYSSGWVLMARKGVRYFWQGGSQSGYTNLVLHLPDNQTTVLILTNRNDAYDLLKMAIYIAKLFDKNLKLLN